VNFSLIAVVEYPILIMLSSIRIEYATTAALNLDFQSEYTKQLQK